MGSDGERDRVLVSIGLHSFPSHPFLVLYSKSYICDTQVFQVSRFSMLLQTEPCVPMSSTILLGDSCLSPSRSTRNNRTSPMHIIPLVGGSYVMAPFSSIRKLPLMLRRGRFSYKAMTTPYVTPSTPWPLHACSLPSSSLANNLRARGRRPRGSTHSWLAMARRRARSVYHYYPACHSITLHVTLLPCMSLYCRTINLPSSYDTD